MKKWFDNLYEKNELYFTLVWIGIYCAANSLANPVSEAIGIDSSASLLFNSILTMMLFMSYNLWFGFAINFPAVDTACYILSMLCVGFLEEVIFRGFLFKALAKDNVKTAIIISSVTFGLRHILNLFNGSGMDMAANLWQIVVSIACGFLFVIIFYRGGSLIPCIIAHSVNNAVSVFANNVG